MEHFTMTLAGITVDASCRFAETHAFCAGYLTPDAPAQLSLRVTAEDCAADKAELTSWGDRQVEPIALYRLLAERLPLFDRAVVHAAAISYRGRGYLFTAPSGVGKSTHIALWRRFLGEEVTVVNGDKPILSLHGGESFVSGTPWCGKEGWQSNVTVPVAGVCLLRRGEKDRIVRADAGEFLPELLRQIYFPQDTAAMGKTMELTDGVLRGVPFYVLECTTSETAVRTAFEAMTGERYPKGEKRE